VLVLQEGRIIYDEEQKKKILEMVSDEYSIKILSNTMKEYKTVNKISAETKIPVSTIYRRIRILEREKLLMISGMIDENGKKVFLYKSKIKTISTFFNGDFVKIEIVPNKIEKLQDR
jgi:DNA-binding transcriptional ArsR family regulator